MSHTAPPARTSRGGGGSFNWDQVKNDKHRVSCKYILILTSLSDDCVVDVCLSIPSYTPPSTMLPRPSNQ